MFKNHEIWIEIIDRVADKYSTYLFNVTYKGHTFKVVENSMDGELLLLEMVEGKDVKSFSCNFFEEVFNIIKTQY